MAAHLTGSDCGFNKCCISNAEDGTDDGDMLWNGSEEDGNVRRKMKALTVKMETVALIGEGK
jgi:hypothetical protein